MNNMIFNKHFFNLESHLETYGNNTFFEDKTYNDITRDVSLLSHSFKTFNEQRIGLVIQSPYFLLICLIALKQNNVTAVILPTTRNNLNNKIYLNEVPVSNVLDDRSITKILLETPPSSKIINPIDIRNEFLVIFSSGSTQNPKGIVLSFGNIFYSCTGFNQYFNNKKSITLLGLPFHHVSGLMPLWRSFFSGGSVTYDKNAKIDFISIVPTQLYKIFKSENEIEWLKKIPYPLIGGAYLSDSLKKEAINCGINLFETYGMTETSSLLTINGDILPYRTLSITSNNLVKVGGRVLALGHIQNNLFIPYQETLQTNDKGAFENNKFKFIERSDLVFKSGGENINPIILEDFLNNLGFFDQAFITSIQNEKWGQATTLLYKMKNKIKFDKAEIIQQIENHFPKFMAPKHFFSLEDLSVEGIKPNRLQLKSFAHTSFIKSIFSHEFKSNNSDRTVVFLHGFLGTKNDFFKISNELNLKLNYLFIDLPGHGDTLSKNFFSQIDFFNKLRDLILTYTNSPIFYGYSMGGRIALELAFKYLSPQLLILESAGLGLHDEDQKSTRLKIDSELFKRVSKQNLKKFLIHWYEQDIFFHYNKSQKFEFDLEKKLHHPIEEWRKSLLLFSPALFPLLEDNLNELKKTSFPLHYIYGEEDSKYKAMAGVISGLKTTNFNTYAIDNCGHNPHKTHENQIVAILTTALKD